MISTTDERKIREEMDYMLNIAQVKAILNISYPQIFKLIKTGELPVTKVLGEPVALAEIEQFTTGLRFKPSDLQAFLDSRRAGE